MSSTDFGEISIDTCFCFLLDVEDDHNVKKEITMMIIMIMIISIIMMMIMMIDDSDNRTYGFNQYLLVIRDRRSI